MATDVQDYLALEQRPRLQEACIKLHDMALELGPEAKLPTMLELRDRFGMSVKTLNTAVRELERRQILCSINGVGIYVASKTPKVQTGNIGFMTNNLRHAQNFTYWGLIFGGMRAEAERRDRHMLFIDNVERFYQWEKIDGVLLTDVHERYFECPVLPRPPKGMPCLALLNAMPGVVSVTGDDFLSLYELTRYLIGLGHRRIAYVAAFDQGLKLLKARYEGYTAALHDAGIEMDARWKRELYMGDIHLKGGTFDQIGAYNIEQWLKGDWNETGCTAVIAQNDLTARGMIAAFEASGRKVPDEVTVAGFDGLDPALQPALTTVEIPLYDLGQTAVRLLCDWLENPAARPDDVALAGKLIEGSTSAPPVDAQATK